VKQETRKGNDMGSQSSPRSRTVPSGRIVETDVIDYVSQRDEFGEEVYVPRDITLNDGFLIDERRDSGPLSVLPDNRMSGSSWAEITKTLREAEEGRGGRDVVVSPGGGVTVVAPGSAPRTSRLPQCRMAAVKPLIRASDVDEIRYLDPHNVENWIPVHTDLLDGWKFRLQPKEGGYVFVFLAFRSPLDAGQWRLWVLRPDKDNCFGHKDHIVTTMVGTERIPVICGKPGAAPARTLAEARAMASKWAVYTQCLMLGQKPGFSE